MEMKEVRLETERLILRWFHEDDFEQFCRMSADAEVMRFLGDGKPMDAMFTWRQMATFMGHWYFRGYGFWAVEEKSTGNLVGRIGFMNPVGLARVRTGLDAGARKLGQRLRDRRRATCAGVCVH